MSVKFINATPHERLRFREFSALKVPGGRDRYSSMRLPALREAVGTEVSKAVEADKGAEGTSLPLTEKEQASAYRWVLRGLDPDKAARKVRTDSEISANAARPRSEDLGKWTYWETI